MSNINNQIILVFSLKYYQIYNILLHKNLKYTLFSSLFLICTSMRHIYGYIQVVDVNKTIIGTNPTLSISRVI